MRRITVFGSWFAFVGLLLIPSPPEAPTAPAPDERLYIVNLGGVRMEFVRVGKGRFQMGSPEDEWGHHEKREAQKEVAVPEDFYIGKCEVMQSHWEAVMGKNPSYFSRTGRWKREVKDFADLDLKHFPVENVSWDDIQEFLKKFNEREKERNKGWRYNLPTEAQWEYACRGGPASTKEGKKTAPFYFAKPAFTFTAKEGNFEAGTPYPLGGPKGKSLGRTCKGGSYSPNTLGIYDMHGNVYEWCDDLFERGPSRVIRGGSWTCWGQDCRAALRHWKDPANKEPDLGFRLVRVPSPRK